MQARNRRVSRLFLDRELGRDAVGLTEHEAHYLGTVLRLKRGDAVLAFNGRGEEREATIASLARRHAELALGEAVAPLPESPLKLTLIQAVVKAEPMDLIVQKATELGVHALWPVSTELSVIRLDPERAVRRAEHWLRISRSACEQCGRHRPPDILPAAALAARLHELPADGARLVLDIGSTGAIDRCAAAPEAFVLVGPEGGFTAADLSEIETAGFHRVGLGRRTLRADTAAIVACGLLQSLWGDLR